jgi:outer membrane lipoprotein LolB
MLIMQGKVILIFFCFGLTCLPLEAKVSSPSKKITPIAKSNPRVTRITSWEIHGAIAAKNKSKGWSATLNWLQSGPNAYQIRLMGPFGNGSILISKQDHVVYLQSGHRKTSSKNAEELLLKQTGIRLPVNNLYYWIRGLPAPGLIASTVYGQNRLLQSFKQNGYSIHFEKYCSIRGIALPTLMRLEGNELRVKVVIKRWAFN